VESSKRVAWGRVVHALIRAGWNPPTPDERIVAAIGEDIRAVNAKRHLWGNRDMTPTLELSGGEERALRLAAMGLTAPEAARLAGVGRETLKAQLKAARRKLGASTTTEAVAIAIREGFID